ncbi:hypothetical protein [Winogradskyella sp.]|uniref:hypothetical protein n=1 Tax=Winogradskyella sp. TaxID=1883156 RepID=UPI0025D1B4D1|nr:hypothetical protein [Winogradskyella sp.]
MRYFYIIFCFVFLTACDDGDILTVELAFDQELERCENDNESYLIYDTREDPNESLSLIIERNTDNELLFTEPTTVGSPTVLLMSSNTRFIYRTYNRAIATDELCDVIPPADLNIVESYEATTGTVEVTVTIEDDDGDGIPSDLEGRDPNGDGDFSDAQDWDNDGIADYLDEDDDNDNVKTEFELDDTNADGDNDPTTNPLDTDGDGNPDYLDEDDDGDLTPTIEEDEDGDQNPRNDQNTNPDGDLVSHYLNTLEMTMYANPGFTDDNKYTRTITTSFIIRDVDLEILRTTLVEFGILTTTITDYQE